MQRLPALACCALAGLGAALAWPPGATTAQESAASAPSEPARAALERALAEQREAARQAAQLQAEAERAVAQVERTVREAAALAARIQQAEAALAAAEARIVLVDEQRGALLRRLAQRRQPLMQLTASLQQLSRRPLGLAVLQPGGVQEMVYLRALLDSTLPEVERRTAELRAEIDRGTVLQKQAEQAVLALRTEEAALEERRRELAMLETRQRLASRQKGSEAAREAERALALAEQARDLDGLVDEFDRVADLRARLAALPGPLARPERPREAQVARQAETAPASAVPAPPGYRLPVAGRTLAGFGVPTGGGLLSSGLTLSPRPGAQIVAPGAGRVAFAGPYRGYGRIVIIEHPGGWTSLVTGLARVDVEVGAQLVAGSPLGIAPPRDPQVTVELRQAGQPVNPLDFLG